MSLKDMFKRTLSSWLRGRGPDSDVVISTRIRLARNLSGVPFPHHASPEQLRSVLSKVKSALEKVSELANLKLVELSSLDPIERQALVEKHLVSPQHIQDPASRAVILSPDESVSVMVNEEDHLRIQVIMPGFAPEAAFKAASGIDDAFESVIDYAFDEQAGYIAACPTNVGTGLRTSLMVHLPGLAMIKQLGSVLGTVSQVGLAVRGLYGEGSEAAGNLFQISNQVTLGRTEEEITQSIKSVIRQLVDSEHMARKALLDDARPQLDDRVWRSYGVLTHARLLTSEEALRLVSDVRLGIDLGIIPEIEPGILNELMVITQPAHVQKIMGKEMDPQERDVARAALVRERLKAEKSGPDA